MNRVLFVCFALLIAGQACQSQSNAEGKKPILLANYYIWYRSGPEQGKHWSHWIADRSRKIERHGQENIRLLSTARPLAGLYDSRDPEVIDWHVRLAKSAGIDAFLVSWWGRPGMAESFEKLLATARKRDFKIARFDELAQYHPNREQYKDELTNFMAKYSQHPGYLRIEGRPAIYLYQVARKPKLTPSKFNELKDHVEKKTGPLYWIVDKIAHNSGAKDNSDKTKTIPKKWLDAPGVDAFAFYSTFSNFQGHSYELLDGRYAYLVELAHNAGKKMVLPVHPGHDNSRFSDKPYVMPRDDGDTLRSFLRAATDAKADFVMVTSWNEWPETTIVEPAANWDDPALYLRILAEWNGK